MSNDTKIAVLENTIVHIHEVLERIDKRFDAIDKRFDAVDKRFDAVDKRFEAVDRKFEKMDQRFDRLEQNVKHDIARLDNKIDTGFRDLNNRLWFNFIWVVGAFIGVLTLIARLFHWL